ncbi:FAD:protein FMN transferase [Novosphingobium umbonatum]|nr:FAD:protein FMN transferase [Novosphingobium umbonatum]
MRVALPLGVDEAAMAHRVAGLPVVTLPVITLAGQTMGTTWRVLVAAPLAASGPLLALVQGRLAQVVASMSHWQADSELGRFNRAQAGTWQVLSRDFADVMQAAFAIAGASGGAFSPAMGHLVNRWGHGPTGPVEKAPDAAEVAALLPFCDWRALAWDAAARRLQQAGGVALDLSGIAKGFGVDAVSDALTAQGFAHHLVEVGGEWRGRGVAPDGRPWWVDLENPPGADLPPLRIGMHGLAVATSGIWVRGWHTLDPRDGMPAEHVAGCSVLHESAMWADGWASALSVLGPEQGMALAQAQGLAVRWIIPSDQGFAEKLSPALLDMLG